MIETQRLVKRIDAPVQHYSYWQSFFAAMFVVAIFVTALIANISWLGLVLLMGMTTLPIFIMYSQPKQLIYITSPYLYHHTQINQSKWQLLYQMPKQRQLWEADLINCVQFGHGLQLSFKVRHPMPADLTLVIWQDQVDMQTWRRLCVVAKWT